MLNPDFRLAAGATHGTVGVAWTAPADDSVSFVYVNGRLEIEAFAPGAAERAIDVPLAAEALGVIEVHDFAPGDLPEEPAAASVNIAPRVYTRPTIRFASVLGATRYRLYHRAEGDLEARVCDIAASPDDGDWLAMECPVDLAGHASAPGGHGVWHFFRVEAVSAYGVESQTAAWAWRTLDVPAAPTVSVTAGSEPGTFTFIITGG